MTKIEFVSCHRLPERSFFFKEKQFPVCARCTGIYVAYFIFIPAFWFVNVSFLICVLAVIPTIIDGLTQAYRNRESTNFLRFSTGILAGFGLSGISNHLGYEIVALFKFLISTFY